LAERITILVADDHPIFRRGLVETLQTDPELEILFEASDGNEALSQMEELKPDVALLDVHMPKLDGLGVARAAKKRGLTTRIIFLTMHDDEETFTEAMDIGVTGYVLKESAVVDVLNGIRTVAEGRHFISPAISGYLVQRQERSRTLHAQKPGLGQLTPAEKRILRMISQDKTSKEIAEELGISPRTVETHRLHICEKLQLRGVHALVKFAFDNKSKL
jgi:DNA-binding NarL/FixJ family response regulator